eukprot:scaffold18810_cov118-Isochrysis_galbana.AAC.1
MSWWSCDQTQRYASASGSVCRACARGEHGGGAPLRGDPAAILATLIPRLSLVIKIRCTPPRLPHGQHTAAGGPKQKPAKKKRAPAPQTGLERAAARWRCGSAPCCRALPQRPHLGSA